MPKITVYPAKASALVLTHPIDGKLRPEGGPWEADGYTARLITEGSITVDRAKAWRSPQAPKDDHEG